MIRQSCHRIVEREISTANGKRARLRTRLNAVKLARFAIRKAFPERALDTVALRVAAPQISASGVRCAGEAYDAVGNSGRARRRFPGVKLHGIEW
jgi:hypothetical protein